MSKEMLISKSETISVVEMRDLLEVTNTMKMMLTPEELKAIMNVYGAAVARLLKENNEVVMENKRGNYGK